MWRATAWNGEPDPRHDDQGGDEELRGRQVLLRVHDAGQVGVDEPPGQPALVAEPAQRVLPACQRAVQPDGDGQRAPTHRRHVRDQHPPVAPSHEAAEGHEGQEAEVDQHHRVGEEAVDHGLSMSRAWPRHQRAGAARNCRTHVRA